MLDQLVESKSNYESNTKRGGYLFTTAVLVFSLFASGILWSLFAKNLEMGSEGLELASLVAPVPMPETAPPPPEPVQQVKQNATDVKADNSVAVRNDNIARIDENQPIPDKIINTPSKINARPKGEFRIDPNAKETDGSPTVRTGNNEIGSDTGSKIIKSKVIDDDDDKEVPPPPVVAKKPVEPEVKKPEVPNRPISKGVLNGKATSLPTPTYPATAKAIGASGAVNVQVTIDEKGNVISASAISGHALLRQVSENAARGAKFTPTLLSDQPVKVTGIIIYNFKKL